MKRLLSISIIGLLIGNVNICQSQGLLIKPTRTISFTTNEGSYMDVDVSPDGKTLVFDLLGDLYTVPSEGGEATQITRGMAINRRPVWSPDGKKIAYISDYSGALHLNVRDLKGAFHVVLGRSSEQLSYGSDPIWTADGDYLSIGDSLYSLDKSKLAYEEKIERRIGFSRDSLSIYYLDSGKICRYNRVDQSRSSISPELKRYRYGVLSPDGAHWAYISDSDSQTRLIIQDFVNKTERTLIPSLFEKTPNYPPGIRLLHFAFGPDSKEIFLGYGGKIHKIRVKDGIDQIVPFTAQVKADLGPLVYNAYDTRLNSLKVRYTRSANASPDGRHLVFSAVNRIYIMELPEGKPKPLVNQSAGQFQPIFSPDGNWVAYVSWNDTTGGALWRVPSAGGEPERISREPGQYQRPAWSHDGKHLAIVNGGAEFRDRDDPGRGQLQVICVQDQSMHVVDDNVPLWNQLSFSKDDREIVYHPKSGMSNRRGILIVSKYLDGSNEQSLSIGERKDLSQNFIQQRSLSPDGRFVLYAMAEDLWLVPVFNLLQPAFLYGPTASFQAIRFGRGVDAHWERDGKMLCWSYGDKFYGIDPNKIISAAKRKIVNRKFTEPDESDIAVAVIPDLVVNLDIKVPRFYGREGVLVFKDVRILTMHGNKVIDRGTIVIRNGRFMSVGTNYRVSFPEYTKVMELPGKTVIPGLVDLHSHMRVAADVFPQQSWMYLANLAYGVTTVRDPSLSLDSYGYAELLETGQMIGPRLYTVGRSVNPMWGISCKNMEEANSIVAKRKSMGGKVVKQYTLETRIERQRLLIACREADINMTNEGLNDPILQLGMIKDGSTGVEHNPAWGDVYDDEIRFLAKSGTYLTPTLQVAYGTEPAREYFDHVYWRGANAKLSRFMPDKNLHSTQNTHPKDTVHPGFLYPARVDSAIYAKGGHILMGSHGEDQGIGVHNEVWALQMGGFSNMQALRVATIGGAEGIGVQKDLGSIEVGKIADLIVLNGNPLDDIHNTRDIKYVMKNGILYDGNTLDIIWPFYKKCPEWKLKASTDPGKGKLPPALPEE